MNTTPAVMVLGGGPAGTALAAQLAKAGVSTVVCERSRYESPRVGEVLIAPVRPLLQSLEVWERFIADEPLRSPGVVSLWESAHVQEIDHLFSPFGDSWHVDRLKFDRLLAAAAESAGAVIVCGAKPLDVRRLSDGWRVDVRLCERVVRFRSKFMVDATGRSAWLARRLGARSIRKDRLLGILARIEHGGSIDLDRRLLLEAVECGWWYCAPLPNDVLVASCMIDPVASPDFARDPLAFWQAQLSRTTRIGKRLSGIPLPTSVKVVSAVSSRLSFFSGEGWLAVGDAASTWDPLSSQGILKALQESRSAAGAVLAALSGDRSPLDEHVGRTAQSFETYYQTRRDYYALAGRWPAATFWRNRRLL